MKWTMYVRFKTSRFGAEQKETVENIRDGEEQQAVEELRKSVMFRYPKAVILGSGGMKSPT